MPEDAARTAGAERQRRNGPFSGSNPANLPCRSTASFASINQSSSNGARNMSWLDRQSFLGANSEQRLAEMTAGLVGLGGGNSHVAQQLAHAGVGHFALADADHISLTNLNRLIGAPGGTC